MSGNVFLDTNIFVYLCSNDELKKRSASISILGKYICITSTQALNEFCNVFIKKYGLPIDKIKEFVRNIAKSCRIQPVSDRVIFLALDINGKYGYSFYDCLMIASALESGCDILYTEDMNNGQIIENKLKIVDPFKNVI